MFVLRFRVWIQKGCLKSTIKRHGFKLNLVDYYTPIGRRSQSGELKYPRVNVLKLNKFLVCGEVKEYKILFSS